MYKQPICTNCSTFGHTVKQCQKPVTSYGVIVFRTIGGNGLAAQAATLLSEPASLNGFGKRPEYLLIQRRDSIGFVEMIRGKYRLGDEAYIKQNLAGMTTRERERLLSEPFDTLWDTMWGAPVDGVSSYRHEKEVSRGKMEALRADSLSRLINDSGPGWDTPEWGFPKGRRDPHESEYTCAYRELVEETNLSDKDIVPIKNLDLITEIFMGSNAIQYCHKYFVAYAPMGCKAIGMGVANEHMAREVGDIGWFSLEDALAKIRPEQKEKRDVLLRVDHLVNQYCPLLQRQE